MDELTTDKKCYNIVLTKAALNLDKKIYLIRAFDEDLQVNKKYLISAAILVCDELLTSTFPDTMHWMEELYLFDIGNDQNKYFTVTQHQKIKNLQMKTNNGNIFISKSESKAMYKLFKMSLIGYSLSLVLKLEFEFTPYYLANLPYR